ncbi:MAG TPA: hypothetical protein VF316_18645 [Polyangiaceae bacterium]
MSQQVKWVKRPTIRPDDSGAAATLSRSPVSWAAASRVIRERDVSTRELPIIDVAPDDTGELDLDDALAVEVLPGASPKVSVSATCELQAEDMLDVLPLIDRLPMWVEPLSSVECEAPASVAPPPWVIDNFDDLPEAEVDAPPQRRRQIALWIAAATSAASLGVILAAVAVQMEGSAALVLPRSSHHVAAVRTAADRLHAHASQIPVVSLASLRR